MYKKMTIGQLKARIEDKNYELDSIEEFDPKGRYSDTYQMVLDEKYEIEKELESRKATTASNDGEKYSIPPDVSVSGDDEIDE